MRRILVIRGGAIGDFVLTLPAIKLLRDRFPQAHLAILGYRHIIALAENRFYADAVRSLESGRLASFFARGAELPNEWCEYFSGFDFVVSYLFDPDQIFEQNLRRTGVEMYVASSAKIASNEHAARQLARPLEELGLQLSEAAARLYPSAGDCELAENFLQAHSPPVIALHPGSGSASKNWPITNWLQLCQWILQTETASALLLVSGEAEEKEMGALSALGPASRVHRAKDLALPLLAAVLRKCALFLGHDSGISHIAAAVGTPCILLFGATDPRVWAPLNGNVQVLKAPNERLRELAIEDVKEMTRSALRETHPSLSS